MVSFRRPFRIKRKEGDTFDLHVAPELRAGLAGLFAQLDELLEVAPDEPELRRLQPPAYLDDDEREAAYRLLAGDELRTSRRAALETATAGLEKKQVTEAELWSWLQAINALRLVLGTRLDVGEDDDPEPLPPDHPQAADQGAYLALTVLQFEIIRALEA